MDDMRYDAGVFRFDRHGDEVSFSADLGRLRQLVGQQVSRVMAEIDVESIADEVRAAVVNAAGDVREAADRLAREQPWSGPARVRVDIRADKASSRGTVASADELVEERRAILNLVASGKISAEEAARLLDALGN